MKKDSYYDKGGVSVLSIWKSKLSEDEFRGLCKGNVIKYVVRAGVKDDNILEDLKKAQVYLGWLIKTYEDK